MATENMWPTSYTGTSLTNGANAYDNNLSTTAHHSTLSATTATATTSAFASGGHTYTNLDLVIKWAPTTAGDSGVSSWDSYATIQYSTDGGSTYVSTSLTASASAYGSAGSAGGGDGSSGSPYAEGPFTNTITLGIVDPTQVKVQTTVTGHPKTGIIPNWILAATGTLDLYETYLVGTYTAAPTVTSLNGGSYVYIGQVVDIVGTNFTSASSVSINGVSASYSVTNSTTISVTIPPMYILSNTASTSVSVTTPSGTGSASVGNIYAPTLTAISPAITYITQGGTQAFSTTIGQISPTTAHWYCSSGSMSATTTNPSTWTAPTPLSHGYSTSITVWPDANNGSGVPLVSLSVPVYYPPSITNLVPTASWITAGSSTTITPTFSYGDGATNGFATPHLGTTADGTQLSANATSGSGYSTGTLYTPATYTYYLYIRNPAGTVASTTTQVYVYTAPTISSFTAAAYTITYGGSTTLYPTFSNPDKGTGPGQGWNNLGTTLGGAEIGNPAVSGSSYSTGTLYSSTVFYLQIANRAQDSLGIVNANLTVTVVGTPNATSVTPSTTSPLWNAPITVTPVFSQNSPYGGVTAYVGTTGNNSWDLTTNASSGNTLNPGPITSAKTYTLSVFNTASSPAYAYVNSSLVTPQTVTMTNIGGNAYQTVSTAQTFTGASPSGAYIPTVTWTNSAGGGSWVGAQWTAGATPGGPHTITARTYANGTDTGVTKTFSVTLVAVPVATSVVPSTTSPLYGATVTATPTFSSSSSGTLGTGGYGTSDITASPSSGTPYTSAAIIAATTFYLRVSNLAGTTAQVASSVVTPQTVAVGAIGSGSLTRVQRLHTISLSASVTGASNSNVNWTDNGGGSFNPAQTASGATTIWTAPSLKGNYTITATSAGDATKNSTLALQVVTGSGKKTTGFSS